MHHRGVFQYQLGGAGGEERQLHREPQRHLPRRQNQAQVSEKFLYCSRPPTAAFCCCRWKLTFVILAFVSGSLTLSFAPSSLSFFTRRLFFSHCRRSAWYGMEGMVWYVNMVNALAPTRTLDQLVILSLLVHFLRKRLSSLRF